MIIQDSIIDLNCTNGAAVSLGKFDGLHLGHRRIISETVRYARERGLCSAVLAIITPGVPRILTKEEMAAVLSEMGVDVFLPVSFTEEFRDTPAETFLQKDLLGKLRMKAFFSGEDFRFGKGGLGDVRFLRAESGRKGFAFQVVPDYRLGGVTVKSSLIREKLSKMDVRSAGEMLGRPYTVSGIVSHGKRLGSRIGYPTVNILPSRDKFLPGFGVYAARLSVGGCGQEAGNNGFRGILDLGVKPTLEGQRDPAVEVHLFDFEGDLYGEEVTASFLADVRPEMHFPSIEDLREQIAKDIQNVQTLFKD